jgi:SAM-dependent methyltransferase
MNLQKVQKAWDKLGQTAPLHSMLPVLFSQKIKSMDEYFAFGKKHTDEVMTYVRLLGVELGKRRAVDFGCGLGRTTQALAEYFDEVYGLDIAPSILKLASSYNVYPHSCEYILNETTDLSRFRDNSIDFVCSFGVLQAVNSELFRNYLSAFMRILVPGGVLVFQLPSEPARTMKGFVFRVTPATLLNYYRTYKYGHEVYAMKKAKVAEAVQQAGGIVLDVREDRTYRVGESWVSYQYCVSK